MAPSRAESLCHKLELFSLPATLSPIYGFERKCKSKRMVDTLNPQPA